MAVANYHEQYGQLPPAYLADAAGKPMHSWRVLLLPYLEERDLYRRYDFSKPWNSEANLKLAEEMPAIYAFHGEYEPGLTTTNYLAVVGDETIWPGAASKTFDAAIDGTSSTILVAENLGAGVHWMEPRDLRFDTMSLQVNNPQGISSKYLDPAVVMLDGSLRRLKKDLPKDVLRALLTSHGGEQLREAEKSWELLPDGRQRETKNSRMATKQDGK